MSDPILRPSTKEALLHDYGARRCCICQCPHPSFGFGPPMTRETLWACGAHQSEVQARLRAGVQGAGVTATKIGAYQQLLASGISGLR